MTNGVYNMMYRVQETMTCENYSYIYIYIPTINTYSHNNMKYLIRNNRHSMCVFLSQG